MSVSSQEIRSNGFPPGYFVIRSIATDRLLDISGDSLEDGAEVLLWPQTDYSIVETHRSPNSNNQVFFVDYTGALCSRSSGHAIDIDGDKLVLRHRRPMGALESYPNSYAHPLPAFVYSPKSGEIQVQFSCDPAYDESIPTSGLAWSDRLYLLTSVPMRKPKTILDDASQFFSSAFSASVSLLGGKKALDATPDQVHQQGMNIELDQNEMLQEDWGEEAEIDDSSELRRNVRMILPPIETKRDKSLVDKARQRRQWEIIPLRMKKARTGAI